MLQTLSSIFAAVAITGLICVAGRAQDSCDDEGLSLIFQDRPVEEEFFVTEELFANEVDRLVVPTPVGEVGEVTVSVGLVSQVPETPGAEGWTIVCRMAGDLMIDWRKCTTDGTAAADRGADPPGLGDLPFAGARGFNDWVQVSVLLSGPGAFSRMALPTVGTATIWAIQVKTSTPMPAHPVTGKLEWPDMEVGYPSPTNNYTTMYDPDEIFRIVRICDRGDLEITFVPILFKRGDANGDERVDISDAITLLKFLFINGGEPPCLDAADAEDNGFLNITDVLVILNDFFRDGTGIPDPGPFSCGTDPTPDQLDCEVGCSL